MCIQSLAKLMGAQMLSVLEVTLGISSCGIASCIVLQALYFYHFSCFSSSSLLTAID